MRIAVDSRKRRPGFTLIEMVVVISIILILVALLVGGVMRVTATARQTGTRTEIGELEGALNDKFFATYGFYPPSQLQLSNSLSNYSSNQLGIDSKTCITRMFPRINPTVSWNPPGQDPATLQGDQVLVWALGGMQTGTPGVNATCQGFSTNPRDPTTGTFAGPFFNFNAGRLVSLHGNNWLSYIDYYKVPNNSKPYLYFSSFGGINQYNRYTAVGQYSGGLANAASDCSLFGTWPYETAANQYLKPNSFQIISAGRDGIFGPGSAPGSGLYLNPGGGTIVGVYGDDDITNFATGALGGY